jgi:hypothetical protein
VPAVGAGATALVRIDAPVFGVVEVPAGRAIDVDVSAAQLATIRGTIAVPTGVAFDWVDLHLTPRPGTLAPRLVLADGTGAAMRSTFATRRLTEPAFTAEVIVGTWEVRLDREVDAPLGSGEVTLATGVVTAVAVRPWSRTTAAGGAGRGRRGVDHHAHAAHRMNPERVTVIAGGSGSRWSTRPAGAGPARRAAPSGRPRGAAVARPPGAGARRAACRCSRRHAGRRAGAARVGTVASAAWGLASAICALHGDDPVRRDAACVPAVWMTLAAAAVDHVVDDGLIDPDEVRRRLNPCAVLAAVTPGASPRPMLAALPYVDRLLAPALGGIQARIAAARTPFDHAVVRELRVCLEAMISGQLESPRLRIGPHAELDAIHATLHRVNALTVWVATYLGLIDAGDLAPPTIAAVRDATTRVGEIGWILDALSDIHADLGAGVWSLVWLELARDSAADAPWLRYAAVRPEVALDALAASGVIARLLTRVRFPIEEVERTVDVRPGAAGALADFSLHGLVVPRGAEAGDVIHDVFFSGARPAPAPAAGYALAAHHLDDELRFAAAALARAAARSVDDGGGAIAAEAQVSELRQQIDARVAATAAADQVLPLRRIQVRLGLTDLERDMIALLVAVEVEPRLLAALATPGGVPPVALTAAALQRALTGPVVTAQLFVADLLHPVSVLSRGVVVRGDDGAPQLPLAAAPLRLNRGVLAAALGATARDPALAGLLADRSPGDAGRLMRTRIRGRAGVAASRCG